MKESDDSTYRENPKCLVRAVANEGDQPDGLEMRFTDQPPEDVRNELKDAGWVFAPAPENRYWFKREATDADYALARKFAGDMGGSLSDTTSFGTDELRTLFLEDLDRTENQMRESVTGTVENIVRAREGSPKNATEKSISNLEEAASYIVEKTDATTHEAGLALIDLALSLGLPNPPKRGLVLDLRSDWLNRHETGETEKEQLERKGPAARIQVKELGDGRIGVNAPYHPDWREEAKRLDGTWDGTRKMWTFDPVMEDDVREKLFEIYGTDGSPVPMVTVRVDANEYGIDGQEAYGFGRQLFRRKSRDYSVDIGDGVIVEEGRFLDSGGSRRHPRIAAIDVVFRVLNVPESLVDEDEPGVTILRENPTPARQSSPLLSGIALAAATITRIMLGK